MKSKLKSVLIIFLIAVAVMELIKLGFSLMNQSNDLSFYVGIFIVGFLLTIGGYWLAKEVSSLYSEIRKNKE